MVVYTEVQQQIIFRRKKSLQFNMNFETGDVSLVQVDAAEFRINEGGARVRDSLSRGCSCKSFLDRSGSA